MHPHLSLICASVFGSCSGKNSFDGYTPSIPSGVKLDYGEADFLEMEANGLTAAGHSAFVLVAGGLGERLGYSGVQRASTKKTALPPPTI